GWLGLAFGLVLLFVPLFMLLTRWFNKGRPIDELRITAPPSMNTVEQLLKLQNAISQLEELVQDGNVVLLKLRALFLCAFPKVCEQPKGHWAVKD
ncbi:heat-inducible transcription repressor, partial [Thalictrum thalictroides]